MGRPKSPKYEKEFMLSALEDYMQSHELPIIKEVCYQNNWNYVYVMQMAEKDEDISKSIKNLLAKKETELEQGGLSGKYKTAMAIFSLKQLGWHDKVELEQSNVDGNTINVVMKEPTEADVERVKQLKERLFKDAN